MSILKIDHDKNKRYYNSDNKLHRDGGEPAVIMANGDLEWYNNGKRHRSDKDPLTGLILPAIIRANGDLEWWDNGDLHRIDKDPITGYTLPAVIIISNGNGCKNWWRRNVRHRDDIDLATGQVLPAIEWENGSTIWMNEGNYHRDENGELPAIEWSNGDKVWLIRGKLQKQQLTIGYVADADTNAEVV